MDPRELVMCWCAALAVLIVGICEALQLLGR